MARLDAEERTVREPVELQRLSPPEIVDYLRSLPALWADAGPAGRQARRPRSSLGRTSWGSCGSSTS